MSLSSGSCGNCYYLAWQPDPEDEGVFTLSGKPSGILIDAGVSLRTLKRELANAGSGFPGVSAVLVTHDHMDHIRHLGSYCKKVAFPVYAAPPLHEALLRHPFTSQFISSCRKDLEPGQWNRIPLAGTPVEIEVKCFQVPHDASHTFGYAVKIDSRRFLIITDCGRMTPEAMDLASKADTVVIESNYDPVMLRKGSYPEELKSRIRGGHGHMSNEECAQAIKTFWHPGLKNIFLCHLSENNNTPSLAFQAASAALDSLGVSSVVNLQTLPRTYPSPFYIL